MSIVSETLLTFLPGKRKQTPSGWISFNGVCCVHNGESADNRTRGGVIQEGEVVSYHCFNCGYKASWQPGRHISYKLKKLFQWLGAPDDVISKLSLEVLKVNDGFESVERLVELPTFASVPLPDDATLITDNPCATGKLVEVMDYMSSRKLWLDDGYNYYWSSQLKYRDRLFIPFYYENRIVGWSGRTVNTDKKPKYLTDSQPGYLFNLDKQTPDKIFCIVVEGPMDAIPIDGVALLRAEINEQQVMLLKRLNKDIILLPDRDYSGKRLVEEAIEHGWQVSMPDWDKDIKDTGEAVQRYGQVYTLFSIAAAAESSPLKIRLKAKKWFK
mgnify:CR=1 FL=1|tara:strand:+ start:441 stop:1424 length:984 start_codon:yes stop_codon:yes gene_type:complete